MFTYVYVCVCRNVSRSGFCLWSIVCTYVCVFVGVCRNTGSSGFYLYSTYVRIDIRRCTFVATVANINYCFICIMEC